MTEERVKRKLSAILSADVAGYSRLMGEDEVSTIRTLESYRAVMSDLIGQFRGRVVDSPGDNLLAEFSSVVDAVQCAVEIHEVIRAKNEELPEDRRMLFRIGVNLGDVIEEGDRIYGDGVNIAARLEGLAEPGGVCISGSAYEQIKNKLALGYEYIGEHRVKNITEPLKVYKVPMGPKAVTSKEEKEKKAGSKILQRVAFPVVAIIILGAVAIWYFSFSQAPVITDVKEGPKTIAVLPFDNLSSDPEQEYFVDGLSEELISYLSKIPDLQVTSRTSSFSFKDTDKTIQEIATILGREYILEGSVRKVGNALRITAQLIRAADDSHLWSETYERELKDIFDIQEDIATRVADKLKLTLEAFNLVGGTDNLEAYELYMIAKGQQFEGSYAAKIQALELIDAAIALDPKFALAWSLKATIHILNTVTGPANRADFEKDEGLRAVQKAIELEPNLAAAYVSLGYIKMNRGKWIEAESAFRKALQLPTESISADEMIYVFLHYIAVGNFTRAHELIEETRRNDPLNANIRAFYIFTLNHVGDTQRAEEEYERGRELFGDQWTGTLYLLSIIRPGVKIPVHSDLFLVWLAERLEAVSRSWAIGWEYFESPEKGLIELRRIYDAEENLSSAEFNAISEFAAYLGDPEFAMDALEKGYNIDASGAWHFWLPVRREVRQLPRFKEFVREIGLVDYWNKFGWPDICHQLYNGDFECD